MRALATFFLLPALVIAAPAAARIVGTQLPMPVPRVDPFIGDSRLPAPGIGRELRDIRSRIEHARESGDISPREARQLRREARLIGRLADRYGSDALSRSERDELTVRAQALRGRIGAGR
jgi:hypothetical protein